MEYPFKKQIEKTENVKKQIFKNRINICLALNITFSWY